MTNTSLLEAMGRIDLRLIEDAAPDVVHKKPVSKTWVKWGSVAACFALIITVSMFIFPSVIEDISADGYETIYFLGGITVNILGVFRCSCFLCSMYIFNVVD